MSTIIKTYMGIFILLLSVFSMAGVMSVAVDAATARDFHASVITEIEDADFAPSVIQACRAQAQDAGYEMLIDSGSVVVNEYGRTVMMEVILKYQYRIDFLGVTSVQQIRGFAR